MRQSNAERLKSSRRKRQLKKDLDLEGLISQMLGGPLLPTQRAFIYDPAPIKALMGNEGSAKTSTLCAMGLTRALLQSGSRGLVGRADYNDLMNTTKATMKRMLENLPPGVLLDRDKSPPETWTLRPVDPNGEPTTITFMGLKEDLGSYEFNWALVDEAVEVEETRIHQIDGRLRSAGGDYSIGMAFNPPDKHHWMYTACTGKDYQEKPVSPPWVKLFRPNPRENASNLPADYYERRAAHYTSDMRQRLIDGEWGEIFDGLPVYREFNRGFHTKERLNYLPGGTILRFWDFGYRHPACTINQLTDRGGLRTLREIIRENMEIRPFAQLVKAETSLHFPGCNDVRDYGDPAARQKKDTGSTLNELAAEGIVLLYKINSIDNGLRVVRKLLEQQMGGEAAWLIDRRQCPILVSALGGGYRMDESGQKPKKDGFYDHVADAQRYGIDNLFGGSGAAYLPPSPQGYRLPESLEYDRSQDTEFQNASR